MVYEVEWELEHFSYGEQNISKNKDFFTIEDTLNDFDNEELFQYFDEELENISLNQISNDTNFSSLVLNSSTIYNWKVLNVKKLKPKSYSLFIKIPRQFFYGEDFIAKSCLEQYPLIDIDLIKSFKETQIIRNPMYPLNIQEYFNVIHYYSFYFETTQDIESLYPEELLEHKKAFIITLFDNEVFYDKGLKINDFTVSMLMENSIEELIEQYSNTIIEKFLNEDIKNTSSYYKDLLDSKIPPYKSYTLMKIARKIKKLHNFYPNIKYLKNIIKNSKYNYPHLLNER